MKKTRNLFRLRVRDAMRVRNALFYLSCALAVVFAVWLLFSVHTYARRRAHARETARQSAAIYEIFSDYANIPAMRHLMENDEIMAHIRIPGTAINYAVVHGVDNEFYLTRDLRRLPNENGAIFLDYANLPCFSDRSTIIYGHNRASGAKFHDLQLFQERDFFDAHEEIIITTEYAVISYEIFAVFMAHVNFNYITVDFADDEEFLSLTDEIIDRAIHTRHTEITADSRILILSTCTNVGPTGRLVLVGRKISKQLLS